MELFCSLSTGVLLAHAFENVMLTGDPRRAEMNTQAQKKTRPARGLSARGIQIDCLALSSCVSAQGITIDRLPCSFLLSVPLRELRPALLLNSAGGILKDSSHFSLPLSVPLRELPLSPFVFRSGNSER